MWGFAAYITATNYLQAQKIVRPQVVTSAIVLALHAPINLLLIHTFGKQISREGTLVATITLYKNIKVNSWFCSFLVGNNSVFRFWCL